MGLLRTMLNYSRPLEVLEHVFGTVEAACYVTYLYN